mmetsp:Transcript_24198/g.71762  ORF Transcript_24198/g.71762 Transcript_24198/m.71762 type:complete len:261 (-) Transcript_24198:399-1181(-)
MRSTALFAPSGRRSAPSAGRGVPKSCSRKAGDACAPTQSDSSCSVSSKSTLLGETSLPRGKSCSRVAALGARVAAAAPSSGASSAASAASASGGASAPSTGAQPSPRERSCTTSSRGARARQARWVGSSRKPCAKAASESGERGPAADARLGVLSGGIVESASVRRGKRARGRKRTSSSAVLRIGGGQSSRCETMLSRSESLSCSRTADSGLVSAAASASLAMRAIATGGFTDCASERKLSATGISRVDTRIRRSPAGPE